VKTGEKLAMPVQNQNIRVTQFKLAASETQTSTPTITIQEQKCLPEMMSFSEEHRQRHHIVHLKHEFTFSDQPKQKDQKRNECHFAQSTKPRKCRYET